LFFNPFDNSHGDFKIFYEYENKPPISLQYVNYSVKAIEYIN